MKKGFTLVELLAIITILGLIVIIAIPSVNNLMNRQRKGAFEQSVNGIVSIVKTESQKDGFSNKVYNFDTNALYECDNNGENCATNATINTDGSIKNGAGVIAIRDDGSIGLSISNGSYCATKSFIGENISISETGDCPELDLTVTG